MSADEKGTTRRNVLWHAAAAGAAVGFFAHLLAWGRSLAPRIRYEPPKRRRIGKPADFPEGHTFLVELKLFVLREKNVFRAVSAVCTHLGCTVGREGEGYHCPCHGSTFSADGTNTGGPAPRPLPWHPLTLAGGGTLVVDLGAEVASDQGLEIEVPDAGGNG